MPDDLPPAGALVGIVAEQLAGTLRPALSGRLAFEAIMAAGLLGVAARELELGPGARAAERERLRVLLGDAGDRDRDELEAELVARIRNGLPDGPPRVAILAHLRATAADRVAITNPGYLRAS